MTLKQEFFKIRIREWWFGMLPEARPRRFSVKDVANLAIRLSADETLQAEEIGIGIAVRRLGFRKVRFMKHGVRGYAYEPSTRLVRSRLKLEKPSIGTLLRGVQ